MVKMPPDVRATLEKQKPAPVATADGEGTPNVVYVGFLKVLDDETILIGDNFFYKTAANLAENPKVSILCYDTETKKSFQIKGTATVHKEGKHFDEMTKWVLAVNNKLPAKAAVVVKVEEVFNAMWGPTAGKKVV
jgi:hypothetical protein